MTDTDDFKLRSSFYSIANSSNTLKTSIEKEVFFQKFIQEHIEKNQSLEYLFDFLHKDLLFTQIYGLFEFFHYSLTKKQFNENCEKKYLHFLNDYLNYLNDHAHFDMIKEFKDMFFYYIDIIDFHSPVFKENLYNIFVDYYVQNPREFLQDIEHIDSLPKDFTNKIFNRVIFNKPKKEKTKFKPIFPKYYLTSELYLSSLFVFSDNFIDYVKNNPEENFAKEMMTIFVQGNRKGLINFNADSCNGFIILFLSKKLPQENEKVY